MLLTFQGPLVSGANWRPRQLKLITELSSHWAWAIEPAFINPTDGPAPLTVGNLSPGPACGSGWLGWLTGLLLLLSAPAWPLQRLLLAPHLGELGLGKHFSLRQLRDYVSSPEITGTFIVFERKKNLIIEVKEEYASVFFFFFPEVCLWGRGTIPAAAGGTASLQKSPVLQLQLTPGVFFCYSPHLLSRLPNGYGESPCKLTPHWAEKALKILEHHHRLVLRLMQ